MISLAKERRNLVARIGLDTANPALENVWTAFETAAKAKHLQLTKLAYGALLLAIAQALVDEAAAIDRAEAADAPPSQIH